MSLDPRPLPLLLLVSLPLGACTRGADADVAAPTPGLEAADGPGADAAHPAEEAVLVRVGPIEQRAIEQVLEATADVVSLDVVDVFPERTQPVVELLVEEGDRVQAGDLLARLRDEVEQLAVAEAEVRLTEAENEFTRAGTDHERNQSLIVSSESLETALISEREFETSKMALVTAETARDAAQVALDRAQYELRQTRILAPIDGTVAKREISLGDMAAPAAMAFQLVDETQPKAVFHRPQRELAVLHVGQRLTASCEALPGVELSGRIERIAPTVDTESGTVKVTAALETGQPIPIGVLVRLKLVLARHEDALLVPKKALLYEGGEAFCFVVREGLAHRVTINAGFEEPDCLEALPPAASPEPGDPEGSFLLPDDQVVLVGADRLADGDKVELAEDA